jgi:hypothetical protein
MMPQALAEPKQKSAAAEAAAGEIGIVERI